MKVFYRARGWAAVMKGGHRLKYRLPGDTPGLVAALHALSAAGLLPSNATDHESTDSGRLRVR